MNVQPKSLTPLEMSLAARRAPMPQLAEPMPEWGWSGILKLSRERERLPFGNVESFGTRILKHVYNTFTQLFT